VTTELLKDKDFRNKILQGHCLSVLKTLPDKCIDTVMTSPPYWSLRAYQTTPEVWGGDSSCEHIWGDSIDRVMSGGLDSDKVKIKGKENFQTWKSSCSFCINCGAWRGELGMDTNV